MIYNYLNKVICGDCLQFLKKTPDNCIDLIVTDPPFNIRKKYSIYKDDINDYYVWCEKWISECFRVLKSTGSFYLMTLTKHLEYKMPIMAKYGHFINLIIWRNVSACHSKRAFWPEYQPILLYGKTNDYKFNTYAETDKNTLKRWGKYSTEFKGQLKDRWSDIPLVYAGSISHKEAILKDGTNKKFHPCQMPVKLAKRAILFSSNENDIVLDPFSGSGTTQVACVLSNRKFIGFEISQEYCDLSQDRIEATKQGLSYDDYKKGQMSLFKELCL